MITIIVPIYNEEKTIRDFVYNLYCLHNIKEHEVLFVDGGSTDKTKEILDELSYFGYTYHLSDKNAISYNNLNFQQNAVEIKKLYSYVADKPLFSDTLQVNEVLYKISKLDERFNIDKCFEFLNKQKIVLHSKIYELSQGEKKILLFAIGYFTKSSILVLDNPFSGVGLIAKKEILNLLRDYIDENKMIILVTEDPLVIKSLADYIIVLENGRINTKEDIVELQERFNTTDIENILLSIMKGENSND